MFFFARFSGIVEAQFSSRFTCGASYPLFVCSKRGFVGFYSTADAIFNSFLFILLATIRLTQKTSKKCFCTEKVLALKLAGSWILVPTQEHNTVQIKIIIRVYMNILRSAIRKTFKQIKRKYCWSMLVFALREDWIHVGLAFAMCYAENGQVLCLQREEKNQQTKVQVKFKVDKNSLLKRQISVCTCRQCVRYTWTTTTRIFYEFNVRTKNIHMHNKCNKWSML